MAKKSFNKRFTRNIVNERIAATLIIIQMSAKSMEFPISTPKNTFLGGKRNVITT